jgi:molybdopterin synthase sulfur carrier subunit
MARVFVPYTMRKLTGGESVVEVPGKTLGELIDNLETLYPGTKEQLIEDDDLIPGLAATIDREVTYSGLRQKLTDDNEIHFLAAIAGGC